MNSIYIPTVFFQSVSFGVTTNDDSGSRVASIPDFSFHKAFKVPSHISDGYVRYYSNGDVYAKGSMVGELDETVEGGSMQISIGLDVSVGCYNYRSKVRSGRQKSSPTPELHYDSVELASNPDAPSVASITFYPDGKYTIQTGSFLLGSRSFGLRWQKLREDKDSNVLLGDLGNTNEYTLA